MAACYVIPLSGLSVTIVVSFTSISSTDTMGDIEEELGRIYSLVGELSGMSRIRQRERYLTVQPN